MVKTSITHPAWLHLRFLQRHILDHIPKTGGGRALDVGCGSQPYRLEIEKYGFTYMGVDRTVSGAMDSTLRAEAGLLPFRSGSFHFLLCTQVLTHVKDPFGAMREMGRVVEIGGCALISERQQWNVYSKEDYWRFAPEGFRVLAEQGGFQVEKLIPEGGLWSRVGLRIAYFFYFKMPRMPIVTSFLITLSNMGFMVLDRFAHTQDEVVNHLAVCKKEK